MDAVLESRADCPHTCLPLAPVPRGVSGPTAAARIGQPLPPPRRRSVSRETDGCAAPLMRRVRLVSEHRTSESKPACRPAAPTENVASVPRADQQSHHHGRRDHPVGGVRQLMHQRLAATRLWSPLLLSVEAAPPPHHGRAPTTPAHGTRGLARVPCCCPYQPRGALALGPASRASCGAARRASGTGHRAPATGHRPPGAGRRSQPRVDGAARNG